MAAEATKVSDWQATEPYYKYLFEIWQKVARFRYEINRSDGNEQLHWLEQWYEFTNMWYDAISYMFEDDEVTKFDDEFEIITKITKFATFETVGLKPDQSTKIRKVLGGLHRELWQLQGKYHILPKRSQNKAAKDNW